MPAWSLSGLLLVALTAPASGDGATAPARSKPSLKIVDTLRREGYRMPAGRQPVTLVVDEARALGTSPRDLRRVATMVPPPAIPIADPGSESVRLLLRDRLARRPGALDARVEWRLTGAGSNLGLGGGLARIVDTLLHD